MLYALKHRNRSANETLDDILTASEGIYPKKGTFCKAKTWIIDIASKKSEDFKYVVETWVNSAFIKHIR